MKILVISFFEQYWGIFIQVYMHTILYQIHYYIHLLKYYMNTFFCISFFFGTLFASSSSVQHSIIYEFPADKFPKVDMNDVGVPPDGQFQYGVVDFEVLIYTFIPNESV